MIRSTDEKRYHHGRLREALIAAALDHLRGHGAESLSLRALARAAGVSQTAPYRHFPEKEALLAELARGGFEALAEAMERAVAGAPEAPLARLRASGVAYVAFALANPERYRLMFGRRLFEQGRYPALAGASERAYGVLTGLVEEGLAAGTLREAPAEALTLTAWSTVHGLAALMIDGLVPEPPPDLAERILVLLHAGIGHPSGRVDWR